MSELRYRVSWHYSMPNVASRGPAKRGFRPLQGAKAARTLSLIFSTQLLVRMSNFAFGCPYFLQLLQVPPLAGMVPPKISFPPCQGVSLMKRLPSLAPSRKGMLLSAVYKRSSGRRLNLITHLALRPGWKSTVRISDNSSSSYASGSFLMQSRPCCQR